MAGEVSDCRRKMAEDKKKFGHCNSRMGGTALDRLSVDLSVGTGGFGALGHLALPPGLSSGPVVRAAHPGSRGIATPGRGRPRA
jgi:hypothetical protein